MSKHDDVKHSLTHGEYQLFSGVCTFVQMDNPGADRDKNALR